MEGEAALSFGRGGSHCELYRSGLSLRLLGLAMLQLPFPLSVFDRLIIRRFRKSLPHGWRTDFDAGMSSVLSSEAPLITDGTTQGHIVFGSCVLVSYRVLLRANLSDHDAKKAVSATLCNIGKRTNWFVMWLTCRLAFDPFRAIQNYTKHRIPASYGPSFEILYHEASDEFTSEVVACGYRSFLLRHHATELLPLFCEWDKVWIDALPKSIAFSRPQTLAQGGGTCRFEFRRRK